MTTLGWGFLVARGRETGYQLLLVPDFMVGGPDSQALTSVVRGEVPADGPPNVTTEGGLCVVHRTLRPTESDLGGGGGDTPLRDRAGRPLILAFGFVCPDADVREVAEEDLRAARRAALDTYRRFHRAEADFTPEKSAPYRLHSTTATARATARERRIESARGPAAWSANAITPAPATARRRGAGPWLALIIVIVLSGGATATWLATRTPDARVPGVTGLSGVDAEKRVREARLTPKLDIATAVGCRPGAVLGQSPDQGAAVKPNSVVTLTICDPR
jgi:hypothetical protein